MSIKLPAYLILALALVLLLAVLLGFAVLHTVHPAVWQHVITVGPDVVSHSH